MGNAKNESKITLKTSEITIDGSLGLLAYGDIAFREWRKIKKEAKTKKDEKK